MWEYKVVNGFKVRYELNDIGKEGWELVTVIVDDKGLTKDFTYFFKRKNLTK